MPQSTWWTADTEATECQLCSATFNFTRRKHHCRACGGIYCGSCSRRKLELVGQTGPQRVCDGCWREFYVPPPSPSKGSRPETSNLLDWDDSRSEEAPVTPPKPQASAVATSPHITPKSLFSNAMYFYATHDVKVTKSFDPSSAVVALVRKGEVVGEHFVDAGPHLICPRYCTVLSDTHFVCAGSAFPPSNGALIEALESRNDARDEDPETGSGTAGVRVRLHIDRGWVTLKGPQGSIFKRARGEEVEEKRQEFARMQAAAAAAKEAFADNGDNGGIVRDKQLPGRDSRQLTAADAEATKYIKVLNLTKESGADIYFADVQWRMPGPQGSFKLFVQEQGGAWKAVHVKDSTKDVIRFDRRARLARQTVRKLKRQVSYRFKVQMKDMMGQLKDLAGPSAPVTPAEDEDSPRGGPALGLNPYMDEQSARTNELDQLKQALGSKAHAKSRVGQFEQPEPEPEPEPAKLRRRSKDKPSVSRQPPSLS